MRISDWSSDVCFSDLLDQFGMAGRIISPHQVQSRYSFMRGSDFDEIRVYDHLLGANEIAALAAKREPTGPRQTDAAARRAARSEARRVGQECVSTGRARGAPYR